MFINLNKEKELKLSVGKQHSVLDNQLNGTRDRDFDISKNTKINYILLVNAGEHDININLNDDGGILDLRVLFLGEKNNKIVSKIKVIISASHCKVNFHTVSLLADDSSVNFDGGIVIKQGVNNSEGHLLEENIVLGENVKMKTLPLLDIHSSDVKASHGAKIHRLNKEKLFYLQSKGVNTEDAKKIFVEAYVNKVFEKFEDIEDIEDIELIKKLKESLLEQIIL